MLLVFRLLMSTIGELGAFLAREALPRRRPAESRRHRA